VNGRVFVAGLSRLAASNPEWRGWIPRMDITRDVMRLEQDGSGTPSPTPVPPS
jgi:hypothetical protein